jgi:uncharacterized protein YsxB (DUF464 family)
VHSYGHANKQLLGSPLVLTLLFCSAYSTLRKEAVCSSESSVAFNGLHGITHIPVFIVITIQQTKNLSLVAEYFSSSSQM